MTEASPEPASDEPTPEELARQLDESLDLAERCRHGDPAAIQRLIEQAYPRVVRIVRVHMYENLRSKLDVEEIVNSAVVVALRKASDFEYREPASMIRWLAQIAINKAKDRGRYHEVDIRNSALQVCIDAFSEGDEGSVRQFQLAANDTLPPDRAIREEHRLLIDSCISELPADQRQVLIHRRYDGGSWDYVAGQMNRSKGATQMLYDRAKKALKESLARRRVGPE